MTGRGVWLGLILAVLMLVGIFYIASAQAQQLKKDFQTTRGLAAS